MDTNEELYKIIFTNDAINEMENVFNYISEKLYAPKATKNLMLEIDENINNLKYMPRKYRTIKKYDELDLEYRRMIIKKYCIIYTINENEKKVYITHLYHSKQDYFNLF